MPGTTTRRNLTYPLGSDPAGYTSAAALSIDIDNKLSEYRAGTGAKMVECIGMFEDKQPNIAGWIVLNTDIPFGTAAGASENKMVRIDVRGYTYAGAENIIDLSVNLYMWMGQVYNPTFNNTGTMMLKNVYIMRNTATNTLAVGFQPDAPGDYWQYPKIVADGWVSYTTELATSQFSKFTITRDTNLAAAPGTYFTVYAFTGESSWQPLTLQNGWVNYDGGTHTQARYRKINNIVQVQGLVNGGPQGVNIATLPAGYQSGISSVLIFPAQNGGQGRIDVWPDGGLFANGPWTGWMSLSNITFPTFNS